MSMGQQRFTPSPDFPPPPPFAPMVGEQLGNVHTIAPQIHNGNDTHPVSFETQPPRARPVLDLRRSSDSNSKDHVSYEGYTLLREPVRSAGQERTWGIAKRCEWRQSRSGFEEFVKKQQKKRGDGREQLESSELDGLKRKQIERLIEDRNSKNDPRYEYQPAAIKLERFLVKGQTPDTKVWIVLKRQLRPGLRPDPYMRVAPPPAVIPREQVDLTSRYQFEFTPQEGHGIPMPRQHGNGPIPFHSQSGHGPWQPSNDQPMIIDDRFVPQHPIDPLGQEQPRGPPQAHHMSPDFSDEGPEQFRPGGQGNDFNLKDEKRKAPVKMQRQNSSDSSSASDIEICSINSDETRPTTISSGRSTYSGDRRSSDEGLQRKPIIVERDDRGGSFRKEKKDGKGKGYNHNSQRRANSSDRDDHGGSFRKDKKNKGYHKDSYPQRSDFSDREDRGRSHKDKRYQQDSYQRTSRSHERDRHSSNYKQDKKASKESHQHPSHSLERDDHGRGYKGEKKDSRDDRHRKSDCYYESEHEPIQYATREHARKAPRPRGGSITSGSQYTDDDYIMIPERGSRRGCVLPRSYDLGKPQRQSPVIDYVEDPRDRGSRGIGRRSSVYQPKTANRPYRGGDLYDDRSGYARERGLQRQRELDLELQRKEDLRVEELVREQLAIEEDEMRIEHRVRSQIVREESERRIREKAREQIIRARLAREQPYGRL
ncbi:hypothetical protein N7G274_000056 [Stereocaulon virgatum]|uniref:Uncharacterized protein n=1 Tax=Stereocaulon virgatum TaxID=373712 RepID=A0ABR4ARS3_9LECA